MLNRGSGLRRNRSLGAKKCTCPNCEYEMDLQRGVPCNMTKCPKCGTLMKGDFCR